MVKTDFKHRVRIAKILRNMRKASGATQSDCAEIIGVQLTTYSRYEIYRQDIKLVDFLRLCDFFNYDPSLLTEWREHEKT